MVDGQEGEYRVECFVGIEGVGGFGGGKVLEDTVEPTLSQTESVFRTVLNDAEEDIGRFEGDATSFRL